MLYPKSKKKKLDKDLFKNPTSEYRAAPFWSWNCEISKEIIDYEIKTMKEMGFGGFHIHPRVGLATPYLSDEYMELIKYCLEKAKENNMKLYLYDEDKWASGYAGGYNTKIIENRKKTLIITKHPYNDGTLIVDDDIKNSTDVLPKDKYYLLCCYDVKLSSDGTLKSYKKIELNKKSNNLKLFAYVVYDVPSAWYNNQTYVDTLSKSAIENFVKITHERYKEVIGKDFGKTVPSIFTDEPQTSHKTYHIDPFDDTIIQLPYTTDLDETFKNEYGYSLLDKLPEVFYELPNNLSQVRYHYHDHIAERFASAYADTIGKWCDKNNLLFTGHMMMEPALWTQTIALGETMRSYRAFTIPGIDMLSDHHELSTAKQCQSAVRQYGREGMSSELYGVTDWNYDFRGHKQQGDWQAAFGVTLRVPHLFWMSMNGDAKRDYPASIGYQSPWYKEYNYIENHFARVNTVMTRGKPIVNVGVIHPVESYWLKFGPIKQTLDERNELQRKFYEMINWLVFTNHDFDLISESLLPSLYSETDDKKFKVGFEKYDVIILPNMLTIRSSTLSYLSKFVSKGGKVIIIGDTPQYIDAIKANLPGAFLAHSVNIDWNKKDLLNNLEDFREILITTPKGDYATNIVYNYRQDTDSRHLFIAHVVEPKDYDTAPLENYTVRIKGHWIIKKMDTLSSEISQLDALYDDDYTYINWACYACDSLLLELKEGIKKSSNKTINNCEYDIEYLQSHTKYTLSEPNVLLLDMAKFSINNGDVSDKKYVLDIDTQVRKELGIYKPSVPQPWLEPKDKNPKAIVSLYFEFESEINVPCSLALEGAEYSDIYLNGKKANSKITGFYIDKDSIKTVKLSNLKKGINEIRIDISFCDVTKIEAVYLLGDFGVELTGTKAKIVKLNDELYFDDLTRQKLPFYGANVTYHITYKGSGDKVLYIQRYTGACISVCVDGKKLDGLIAFPPNQIQIKDLKDGEHTIDITLFGTRVNTLGHNHHILLKPSFVDPSYWKPTGKNMTYEYLLRPTGIYTTPIILSKK